MGRNCAHLPAHSYIHLLIQLQWNAPTPISKMTIARNTNKKSRQTYALTIHIMRFPDHYCNVICITGGHNSAILWSKDRSLEVTFKTMMMMIFIITVTLIVVIIITLSYILNVRHYFLFNQLTCNTN